MKRSWHSNSAKISLRAVSYETRCLPPADFEALNGRAGRGCGMQGRRCVCGPEDCWGGGVASRVPHSPTPPSSPARNNYGNCSTSSFAIGFGGMNLVYFTWSHPMLLLSNKQTCRVDSIVKLWTRPL
eukprot:scaffold392462_cov21-Prasinocladus_malaysianus.AAC.2